MGKTIAIIALVVVCVGLGVLVGGLSVFYANPRAASKEQDIWTNRASCVPRLNTQPANSDIRGYIDGLVSFMQPSNKYIKITVNVTGLPRNNMGFHIHTYGIQDGDCKTAGPHFNPKNQPHGGPESTERHVGDLGNIDAALLPDDVIQITDSQATLFGKDSIIGRSIVIHQRTDDLKAVSSAGPRFACCTIQINAE